MKSFAFITLLIPLLISLSTTSFARGPVEGATPHPLVPMLPDGHISYLNDYDYVEMTLPYYKTDEEGDLTIERKTFHGFRQAVEYSFPDQDHFLRTFRSYVNRFENDSALSVKYAKYGNDLRSDLYARNASVLYRDASGNNPEANDFSERGYVILEPSNASDTYSFITVSIYKPRHSRNNPGMRVFINQFTYESLDLIELPDVEIDLTPPEKTELESSLIQDGKAVVNAILFEFDSDVLMEESSASIDVLVSLLKENPELKLYIVGHTDWIGSYEYNLNLSKSRSASVVNRLVDTHSIDRSRLVAVGVGPVAPVTSNETEQGRALNRRVEIVNFQ